MALKFNLDHKAYHNPDGRYSKIVWPAILKRFEQLYDLDVLRLFWFNKTRIERMRKKWLRGDEIDILYWILHAKIDLNFLLPEWEYDILLWAYHRFQDISFYRIYYYYPARSLYFHSLAANLRYLHAINEHFTELDRRTFANAFIFLLLDIYKYSLVLSESDFLQLFTKNFYKLLPHKPCLNCPYPEERKLTVAYARILKLRSIPTNWKNKSYTILLGPNFNIRKFKKDMRTLIGNYRNNWVQNIQEYIVSKHSPLIKPMSINNTQYTIHDFSVKINSFKQSPFIRFFKYYLPTKLSLNRKLTKLQSL